MEEWSQDNTGWWTKSMAKKVATERDIEQKERCVFFLLLLFALDVAAAAVDIVAVAVTCETAATAAADVAAS